MKIVRKVFLYTLITLLVLVCALVGSVFLFKDRIIQQFIVEANKNIGTPIKIKKIEVSMFQDFPRLAIVLNDVYVEDSHPGEYPLLTAKKISFTLNPIEVWQGNYAIRGLEILESETNLRIDKNGKNNYTIVKDGGKGSAVSFDLKNIKLTTTIISYIDNSSGQHHEVSSANLRASIKAGGDVYHIETIGDIVSERIGIRKSIWFEKKVFDINAALDYDDKNHSIAIAPSKLLMDRAAFEISGLYSFKGKDFVDIHTVGKETDIQLLLSFFPSESVETFKKYRSKGDVYFDMKLKGEISEEKSPFLSVAFGLKNVTVFHPDTKSKIENANLEGSFATTSIAKMNGAELFLKNISGNLNGDAFNANFTIKNFDNPFVVADFHGEVDAAAVLNFYPIKDLKELSGRINANVSISGPINLLKNKATAQQVRTEGTIDLSNINYVLGDKKLRFVNLNGSLQFNNNDLAMSDLRGQFENNDFILNGFFKNIITFLIFENQPIGIEADLKSNFLDIDQLFSIGFGTQEKGPYKFDISNNLNLNFTYSVKSMRYKRFHPSAVKGDLLVKGKVAVARNIHLQTMGGSIDLNGIVDAKNSKAIELISSAKLNGIEVDSLFYVFENFQQTFIDHKNLKGRANADISLETTLDESLHLFSETLVADLSVTIKNGELNNFAPMQNLNKYLDDEGLSKLRFADLKNDIHIENKTIYIPQMEIKSNLTAIQLSGTHTFDQKIDYRLIAPLRNKTKIDPDEAFGAIEQDTKGQSKLFLKIIGTTDNYQVLYDKQAVKKKISADLKKEVQELKDAFKLKGQKKKKELELEKDEYFDWEEPAPVKKP